MRRDRGAAGVGHHAAKLVRAAVAARKLARRLLARRGPGAHRGRAGRIAALARRWALWARSLASRFGRASGAGARLAPTFRRWNGSRALHLVERILERVRPIVAPPLLVSLEPRLALAWRNAARPEAGRAVRRSLAGGERRAPAFVRRASASALVAPGRTAPPLLRTLARGPRAAAASPVERLAAPARKRLEAADLRSAERAPLKRLFARTRHESLPERPATRTLHRPARPPVERPIEAQVVGRRRTTASEPPAMPASVPVPSRDLDRLTEQVVQRIDRRMTAWRERTGRTR